MAKNKRRIFILGNEFVEIYNKEIIFTIKIPREILEQELDKQVRRFYANGGVARTFMKAVSEITGIPFSSPNEKIKEGEEIVTYSIHDSSLYRHYQEYILNHEVMAQNIIRKKEDCEGRRQKWKNEHDVLNHIKDIQTKRFRRKHQKEQGR